LAAGVVAQGQQASNTNADHHCDMAQRGDQAMGFSAAKTTHHFHLLPNGGAIEVEANDPKDTASRDQIRMHLSHIASMFAEGDFNAPMFIHDTTPPGVPTMIKLHSEIRYQFEETATGGRVEILTQSGQALDAVHAFLLFQIIEHQTGDSAAITATLTRLNDPGRITGERALRWAGLAMPRGGRGTTGMSR
jgi:hypothetical protein